MHWNFMLRALSILLATSVAVWSCGGGGRERDDETIIIPPRENRAPVAARTFADITLTLGAGGTVRWESDDIGTYFSDPDNDPLFYWAESNDVLVADVTFEGTGAASSLVVEAFGPGTAPIRVTAEDKDGLGVVQSFTVTVEDRTVLPPDHSDTRAGAREIVSGDAVEGYLDSPDDVDFFRMRIADTRLIDVTLMSEESGVEIAFVDNLGNILDTAVTASQARLRATAQGGDIFVRVRASGSGLKRRLAGGAKAYDFLVKIGKNVQSFINVLQGKPDIDVQIGGVAGTFYLGEHFEFPTGSTGRAFRTSLSAAGVTVTLERDVLRISTAHGVTPGTLSFTVTASAFGLPVAVKLLRVTLVEGPNQPPRSVCDATVQRTVDPGDAANFTLAACFQDEKPHELVFEIADVAESSGEGWGVQVSGADLVVRSRRQMNSGNFITVVVTATDSEGLSARQAFRVNLNKAPYPVETQILSMDLDPGGGETIDLANYFRDPEGTRLTFATGAAPSGLTLQLSGSSLTVSADSDAGGAYTFQVTVTTADARSKEFTFHVNVKASLRALKELVIRVMAGKTTTVRLAEFIGFPQGVTNPPPLNFVLRPGTHAGRLRAAMDAAAENLTIAPPSDLEGEFSLQVQAIVVDARFAATDFTFQVIVEEAGGPRKIDGGPALSVSLTAGSYVSVNLTDYIEDPLGGPLSFSHGSLPRGFAATLDGAEWGITTLRETTPGDYAIVVTATDSQGRSADFDFRVVVEESEDLGPEWIRASNVDCHVHRDTLGNLGIWEFERSPFSYSGGCKERRAHGRGVAVRLPINEETRDVRYDGDWKDGRASGVGTTTGQALIFAHDYTFEGEFLDGALHGQATLTWSDGSRYKGQMRHNHFHGQGVMYNAILNERWEGEWRDSSLWNGTQTDLETGRVRTIRNGQCVDCN